jgi:two-component system invasion response regulator UvrY
MRMILADDQVIVRSALRLLLTTKTSHSIIAEAATADELIAHVQANAPDIILLDWGLPGEQQPAGLLAFLRERWPTISLIVLSSHPDVQTEALQAGAAFFVSKTGLPEEVLEVIENVPGGATNKPDLPR